MPNNNVREFVVSSLKKYHEKLNKQLSDSSYISAESDPTVPDYVKNITSTDISNWNAAEANVQSDWNITNSSSAAYIKNKPNIPSTAGLATETYVDEKVASIVNSAPETLDTLNELADALGNDPNFATTVSNQIGTKVSKTELSAQSYITTTDLNTRLNTAGYISSVPNELPSYSSSDNGKILSVNSSGQLVWITPVSIYTGSGEPANSIGNDGDIYLQS